MYAALALRLALYFSYHSATVERKYFMVPVEFCGHELFIEQAWRLGV